MRPCKGNIKECPGKYDWCDGYECPYVTTVWDWIREKASYHDLRQFIWWVYHRGNEDGKHCAEDSPPGGLPSYFGDAILDEDIDEVGFFTGKEPNEEDYDWKVVGWKKIDHNNKEE